MENVYYVGLDVHKETVEMSVFRNSGNEPEYEKRLTGGNGSVLRHLHRLQRDGRVEVCYEAGCMGFTLQRILNKGGIDCRIVSPGKLPRKPTDFVKTDRRDARNLARLLRAGEASGIYIPDAEDEATRDYIRARDDVRLELKRAKQHLLKFLLRLGYRYETNVYWTGKHRKWMKELMFAQKMHEETFHVYYMRVMELEERLVYMDAHIEEMAKAERYREGVAMLRCFKGIDYLTALAIVCEVGDFRRFPDAGSFMAYLGLTPREHSSGEKRRQGGITKSGNGHLRRLLVEASWHYRRYSSPGWRLTARRCGQNAALIAYADHAMRRLQKKFARMLFKGKTKNVAVIAVSRELAGFIWGCMNEKMAI